MISHTSSKSGVSAGNSAACWSNQDPETQQRPSRDPAAPGVVPGEGQGLFSAGVGSQMTSECSQAEHGPVGGTGPPAPPGARK